MITLLTIFFSYSFIHSELLCTAVSRCARACWRRVLDWTVTTRTTTHLLCWQWKRDKTRLSSSWWTKEPVSTSKTYPTTWMCCIWPSRRIRTIRCCCCLRQPPNAWSIRPTRSSWRPSIMLLNTAILRLEFYFLFFDIISGTFLRGCFFTSNHKLWNSNSISISNLHGTRNFKISILFKNFITLVRLWPSG